MKALDLIEAETPKSVWSKARLGSIRLDYTTTETTLYDAQGSTLSIRKGGRPHVHGLSYAPDIEPYLRGDIAMRLFQAVLGLLRRAKVRDFTVGIETFTQWRDSSKRVHHATLGSEEEGSMRYVLNDIPGLEITGASGMVRNVVLAEAENPKDVFKLAKSRPLRMNMAELRSVLAPLGFAFKPVGIPGMEKTKGRRMCTVGRSTDETKALVWYYNLTGGGRWQSDNHILVPYVELLKHIVDSGFAW